MTEQANNQLPKAVREYMARMGRKGGAKKGAKGFAVIGRATAAEMGRRAMMKRWHPEEFAKLTEAGSNVKSPLGDKHFDGASKPKTRRGK